MLSTRSTRLPRNWRKSSYSGQNGDCVEVAGDGGTILVRDTKDRRSGPVLTFTAGQWRVFADAVREH